MKKLALLIFIAFSWIACKNDTPQTTEPGDASQLNSVNENATGQYNAVDSNQMQEAAAQNGLVMSKSELVGASNSTINGHNVNMRADATVKSEKTGTFENNESVEILGTKNVQNEGEAILSKSITVKGSGGTVTLPKGKAVVVEDYIAESHSYLVSYEDPKKGKLSAQIEASAAETIIYATWYQVKRSNGETGWVLGKFLKFK